MFLFAMTVFRRYLILKVAKKQLALSFFVRNLNFSLGVPVLEHNVP